MKKRKHYKVKRSQVYVLIVAVVSLLGVVTHAAISSYDLEQKIAKIVDNVKGNSEEVPSANLSGRKIVIPFGMKEISAPRDGAYNSTLRSGDGLWEVLLQSYRYAMGQYPQTFGWYFPFPFLIPFIVHLGFVLILPLALRAMQPSSVIARSDVSFGKHALVSSVYAYFVVVFFQASRMLWGSESWEGAYFVSFEYGWKAFYIFTISSIGIYLYCVIGTTGLQVSRKQDGGKRRCIRCGYALTQDNGSCQECGLEEGAWMPSKWRINHWYLGAMFLATFFSPVLVASVYSVFG